MTHKQQTKQSLQKQIEALTIKLAYKTPGSHEYYALRGKITLLEKERKNAPDEKHSESWNEFLAR